MHFFMFLCNISDTRMEKFLIQIIIHIPISETSSTYAEFQRTGQITPPAKALPNFKSYTVDDFHFLTVLGTGSFGKVCVLYNQQTVCVPINYLSNTNKILGYKHFQIVK